LSLYGHANLYWHTLRFLRPVQIYGRLLFRLAQQSPKSVPAPAMEPAAGVWVSPASRRASLTGPVQFRFLNEVGDLSVLGWDNPQREKLWRYNLHYFDDLNADGADRRRNWHLALLRDWVHANPPVQGTGWEPYPCSLRIVNWLKWHLAGNTLPDECVQSLAMQAMHLSKRLEWHLLGNHLFSNAKALIFSGLAFSGPEAQRWLSKGLQIVGRELPEQVLEDGGNFERSPMYHSIFLEDLLDLINAAATWPDRIPVRTVGNWRELAARMLAWLLEMTHPDGEISLFNDAAIGVTPSPASLVAYAKRLGIVSAELSKIYDEGLTATCLSQSGYVHLVAPGASALLDVAQIGPDYLPGHAHADTLSFELSVFDQRVVVNGGTSRYGLGAERLRERGTAAHSTVEIDGENSSEVWSGFRVARRAYPFDYVVEQQSQAIIVACSHDGYRRLPGKPIHRREWHWSRDSLVVRDKVTGCFNSAVARYILHPSIKIESRKPGVWSLGLFGGRSMEFEVFAGEAHLVEARYAPEFGAVLTANCIAVRLEDGSAQVNIRWN